MEIIFIVLGFIAAFLIGWLFAPITDSKKCECHNLPIPSYIPPYVCGHYGYEFLQTKLEASRREAEQAKNERDYYKREAERRTEDFRSYTAMVANRPIGDLWFKTVGDKERAAEKLKEAMKPLKELEKELGK